VIGQRPVDLHLKGLRALGAKISVEHGDVVAEAPALRGANIYLGGPFGSTVGGTVNVMMAAVLAKGRTVIENAACEPEVADLAGYLNEMGARVSGMGSPRLVIEGVESLNGVPYTVIPDRIEAGTLMIAAAVAGGDVDVKGARPDHLNAVVHTLQQIGVMVSETSCGMKVVSSGRYDATDVVTLTYPGFPTDLQAQTVALLARANGISVVTEKIYPDRFMHIAELNRLGANIRKEGPSAIIVGVHELSGAQVMASDLRASVALVLAGLVAKGRTEVHRVYHLDRGYERIEERLRSLGAQIHREPAPEP
jgi:UDP-N-acetylglucosamine 1-carboxyvinyltransferase